MGEKRIFSMDFVKAIAILAVVQGHIASPLGNFIYAWHMPVFFLATGFLSGARRQEGVVPVFNRKEFLSLGQYYLAFCALGIVIECLKIRALGRTPLDVWETVAGVFYYMDYPHFHHYGFVLWFLPALFWGRVMMRAMLRFSVPVGCTAAVAIFVVGVWLPEDIILPFGLRGGMLATLWCLLGYFLYAPLQDKVARWDGRIAIAGGVLLLLMPIPGLNLGEYALSTPLYNVVYSTLVFIVLFAIGNYLGGADYSRIKRIISYLSYRSIYIMALHVYTNNAASLLRERFFPEAWWLAFLCSVAFLIPIFAMLEYGFHLYQRKRGEV